MKTDEKTATAHKKRNVALKHKFPAGIIMICLIILGNYTRYGFALNRIDRRIENRLDIVEEIRVGK